MSDDKTQPIGPGDGEEPTVGRTAVPQDGTPTGAETAPEEGFPTGVETAPEQGLPTGAETPVPGPDAAPGEQTVALTPRDGTARPAQAKPAPAKAGPTAAAAPSGEAVVPDEVPDEESGPAAEPSAAPDEPGDTGARKRVSGAGVVIGLLLVLLGFTLVVQLKSNSTDQAYASLRQEDLVTILADLDAREDRLQQDISALDASRRELASGAASREQILKDAGERADDLGILAGTLPAQGPGVTLTIQDGTKKITAAHLLNAVQELRGAGAEAMQIDADGGSVRVVASTHFVDVEGDAIEVDGVRMTGPYTITAIGPADLAVAMKFRGGVVDDVTGDGGTVIVSEPHPVDITTVLRSAPTLEYAKPVS